MTSSRRTSWISHLIQQEGLPGAYAEQIHRVWAALAEELAAAARASPGLVVGVYGTQASGKTTLCAVLERLLVERGVRAVTLALDDLYLPRGARERLAREIHPLLVTRGPPGTHDVALGLRLLDELRRPGPAALPRFDKAADDRRAPSPADVFDGPADLILFEGWCVGARPQAREALAEPVNALEREEDSDGRWRRWVNDQLAGPYQELFARIDRLVLLRPPSFEVVLGWRQEQERKLRDRRDRDGRPPSRAMSDDQVARFIAHYERLTRWIIEEMPGRADLVFELDAERRPERRGG